MEYKEDMNMKRKIIRQGHNTLTITLPSQWTKQFNLEPGCEIDIIEKDNGLFLSTEKNNENKKIELELSGLDIPTIWKYFMGIYRQGYDEVIVKYNIKEKMESPYKYFTQHKLDMRYGNLREKRSYIEFIHDVLNRFIGYEIISHDKETITIKEISEPTSKEFDNSLRRVFLLVLEMAEETCEALKNSKPKDLIHIHDTDINLDKFHDYCIRILNKIGNKDSRKTSLLSSTLFFLELIGDEYKNISHHLLYDFKNSDFKNIIDIAESVKEQIELFYSMFYKFDKEKVIKISEIDKKRYFNVVEKYKKTKTPQEKEIFHHLRIITRYINTLTELRIQMEF